MITGGLLIPLFLMAHISQAQTGPMQPFSPGPPEVLVDGNGHDVYFMSPVWSPDGRQIAFTSAQYRGIWVIPADGGTPAPLTDEPAAGFGFRWSSDGTAIAARTARFDDRYRLNAIKVFDVESGTETVLKDFQRGQMGLPTWTNRDQTVAVEFRQAVELLDTGMEPARLEKQPRDESVLIPRNNRIEKFHLDTDGPEFIGDFGDRTILNLVPSPDGSMMAVEIMGEGVYVLDADGSNVCEIGRAEHPVWTVDGRYLIAMITEDDGHHITGSELYAIEVSTSRRFHLTAHTDLVAMHPTVSPDGRKVAFGDNGTGRIYIMSIR